MYQKRLFVDSYFQIGSAHLTAGKPCQDYAGAETENDFACVIVSDGCSSGARTDIGARLNVLITAAAIKKMEELSIEAEINLVDIFRDKALAELSGDLGLDRNDLLATCLYAKITPNNNYINIIGDGVIAYQFDNGEIWMSRFEWNKNTPFYPAYRIGGLRNFIAAHDGDLLAGVLRETKCIFTNGEYVDQEEVVYSLQNGMRGVVIDLNDKITMLKYIVLFTDGITQIDQYDWRKAVVAMLSYKNTTGEFVKRRAIRELKDSFKIGKGAIDDFACAAIRIEKTEAEGGTNDYQQGN